MREGGQREKSLWSASASASASVCVCVRVCVCVCVCVCVLPSSSFPPLPFLLLPRIFLFSCVHTPSRKHEEKRKQERENDMELVYARCVGVATGKEGETLGTRACM